MFKNRFNIECHLEDYGVNNVRINTDFIAIDQFESKGNLIMMSLVDAPAKLDKLKADHKKASVNRLVLCNDNDNFNTLNKREFWHLNCHEIDMRGADYKFEKKKYNNLSHMIVSQDNHSPYIFKFRKEDSLINLIMNKLINIFFIPCKSELIQEALLNNEDILQEMIIITKNKQLEDIEIYKFNKERFISTLNKISESKGEKPDPIFNQFIGDFTGYINYFKPDILKNLDSKIEQFYDPDNVPEYVTQFPRPLPNGDMRKILNKLSRQFYNLDISQLQYEESEKIYRLYEKADKEGKIKRTDTFNPQYSRQYVMWAAGIKILETEKFLYSSLVMGAGKTLLSLKVNKYTAEHTLKRKNHVTFILCPQSTITQWEGEIELIEKGIGNTKEDYDVLVIRKTKDIIDFYNSHTKVIKGVLKFDKKSIKKPTYILCGKETFKLSQVKRPAFNMKLDNRKEVQLICPNCGQQLTYIKKVKNGEKELPLELDDFFNDSKKKILNNSNYVCKKCSNAIKDRLEFIEAEKEEKDRNPEYEMMPYGEHFTPIVSNIWSVDYNSDNKYRNKFFGKLEASKELDIKYSNFEDVEQLKEDSKERETILNNIRTELGLWNKNNTKQENKKISVVEFLKKKKFRFDSVIIDEAHEGNNASSIIGTAQRLLFKFSEKVILLSGTANNGYASSLHNLLMAAMPGELIKDGTFKKESFVRKYGILKAIIKVDEHGKISGKADLPVSAFKEVEGINPVVFARFLAKNFITVNNLEDLDLPMPELKEKYVPIIPDDEVMEGYSNFASAVKDTNPYMYAIFRASVFENYINNPYSWTDVPVRESFTSDVINIQPENINRDILPFSAKDYEVLEIVKKEKAEGRKCFLFTNFSEGGKYILPEKIEGRTKEIKFTINDRLEELFKMNGIKYTTIQSNTTSVSNRKNWIESKKDDCDVFICQPQLVNVGLNLVFCPTYIVYMPFYKYDIISQATRRGYRANSTEENRIYHLYYKDTCEEVIIDRYQRKLAEAKAIEGEFFVNIEQGKDVRTLSKMSDAIVKN